MMRWWGVYSVYSIDRYVVGTRAKKEKKTGFQTKTRQLLSFSSSFAYFLLLFSLFILYYISCSSISHSSRCSILKIQFQLHTTKLHNAALLCLRMIEFCLGIHLFATRILCCCMLYYARYSLHFRFTLFSRSQECQDSSRESRCSTLASFQITRTKNMVFTAFRWNEKWKKYTRQQLPLGAGE